MQLASKQCLWTDGFSGTLVEVVMTASTGKYIKFLIRHQPDKTCVVDWGDGTKTESAYDPDNVYLAHTYAEYGEYKIVFRGIRCVAFRDLDGSPSYQFDSSVRSVVDYSGQITECPSGAFKKDSILERYICPNCTFMGQRSFAYCTKLKKVQVGSCTVYYDGTFQYCASLTDIIMKSAGICWSYVWMGCASLTELRVGSVSQFATQDFTSTPMLTDIWISDKTVEQIIGTATEGNIGHGYGAVFPWGANETCRFHGTNGIVLGNGTIVT